MERYLRMKKSGHRIGGFIKVKFLNWSLKFQLILILIVFSLIPGTFIFYNLFLSYHSDNAIIEDRKDNVIRDMDDMDSAITSDVVEVIKLYESGADAVNKKEVDKNLNYLSSNIINNTPGLRVGFYLPVQKIRFQYSGPRLIKGNAALNEESWKHQIANDEIEKVLTDKSPSIIVLGKRKDTIEVIKPVIRNNNVVLVAWVQQTMPPDIDSIVKNRNAQRTIFFILPVLLILGLGLTFIVIRGMAKSTIIIKEGLLKLEKDLDYRIPGKGGELGDIVTSINKMAQGLLEKDKIINELKRSERLAALGQLVSGVAHEIRNPLGIIKGTVQVMEKELQNYDIKEYTSIIIEQCNRQTRIIEELLSFAKPGKFDLSKLNINKIIDSVLIFTKPYLNENKINLINKQSNVPDITGDSEQLKQVFVNLILNAVQAMENGGTLTIESTSDEKYVMISFTDTGRGIKEEDMENIFNPFYTTKSSGVGLGLSISSRITNLHNGFIKAENVDKGARVTVFLPV